jgi:hypothetical protein
VAAHKFGCRPSVLAHVTDPVLALDFDLAAAARIIAKERQAAEDLECVANGNTPGAPAGELKW